MELFIRQAQLNDLERVLPFLKMMNLVTIGLFAPNTVCWLAENGENQLIGLAGLELSTTAGLLRNVAVMPEFQRQGIGEMLAWCAFDTCAAFNRRRVYCFGTGAETYWQHLGFRRVSITELVEALPQAPQVVHFERSGWLNNEAAWRKDL
jgi:N-acetylglutamate synthase-like GNAT family acetyltransferase